jgi:hypothetical protein
MLLLFCATAVASPPDGKPSRMKLPPASHTYWVERSFMDHAEQFSSILSDKYCREIVTGAVHQKQRIQEVYTGLLSFLEGKEDAEIATRIFREYGRHIQNRALLTCQKNTPEECSTEKLIHHLTLAAVRHFEDWTTLDKVRKRSGAIQQYAALLSSSLVTLELLIYFYGEPQMLFFIPFLIGVGTWAWVMDPYTQKWAARGDRRKLRQADQSKLFMPYGEPIPTVLDNPLLIAPHFKRREPSPHIWLRRLINYVFQDQFSLDPEEAAEQRKAFQEGFQAVFASLKKKSLASAYVRVAYFQLSRPQNEWGPLEDSLFRVLAAKESPDQVLRAEIRALSPQGNH